MSEPKTATKNASREEDNSDQESSSDSEGSGDAANSGEDINDDNATDDLKISLTELLEQLKEHVVSLFEADSLPDEKVSRLIDEIDLVLSERTTSLEGIKRELRSIDPNEEWRYQQELRKISRSLAAATKAVDQDDTQSVFSPPPAPKRPSATTTTAQPPAIKVKGGDSNTSPKSTLPIASAEPTHTQAKPMRTDPASSPNSWISRATGILREVPIDKLKPHPDVEGYFPIYAETQEALIARMKALNALYCGKPLTVEEDANDILIIDGISRWLAAKAAGLKMVWVIVTKFANKDERLNYVADCQFLRRASSPSMLLKGVALYSSIEGELAKETQGQRTDLMEATSGQIGPEVPDRTAKGGADAKIALRFGISRTHVVYLKALLRHPDIAAKYAGEELSLSAAYSIVKKKEAEESNLSEANVSCEKASISKKGKAALEPTEGSTSEVLSPESKAPSTLEEAVTTPGDVPSAPEHKNKVALKVVDSPSVNDGVKAFTFPARVEVPINFLRTIWRFTSPPNQMACLRMITSPDNQRLKDMLSNFTIDNKGKNNEF